MGRSILHYSWSADLLKTFSQLIVAILTFLNQLLIIFFNRFKNVWLPHIVYIVIH